MASLSLRCYPFHFRNDDEMGLENDFLGMSFSLQLASLPLHYFYFHFRNEDEDCDVSITGNDFMVMNDDHFLKPRFHSGSEMNPATISSFPLWK